MEMNLPMRFLLEGFVLYMLACQVVKKSLVIYLSLPPLSKHVVNSEMLSTYRLSTNNDIRFLTTQKLNVLHNLKFYRRERY